MKKKTKELLKEIQGLEEAQKTYIDEYSVQTDQLKEEEARIRSLRDQVNTKKEEERLAH